MGSRIFGRGSRKVSDEFLFAFQDAYCYLERLGSAVEQMSDTTAGSIFDKVPQSNFEARRAFGL